MPDVLGPSDYFDGTIFARGLQLPASTTIPVPQTESQIQWIRQSDGSYMARIYALTNESLTVEGVNPDAINGQAGVLFLQGRDIPSGEITKLTLEAGKTGGGAPLQDAKIDTGNGDYLILDRARNSYFAPIGSVVATAGNAAPTGYQLCDGSAISRTGFAALFALIGITYGAGDGVNTFNVPDLRGRVIAMVDGGAGRMAANNALANSSGEENHLLSTAEMPSHTHGSSNGQNFMTQGATGNFLGTNPSLGVATNITAPTGGGGTHNNKQPYLVLNYMICTG